MSGLGVHWFVINLDRSPERLQAMSRNLTAVGVSFTRVPAIDGRSLALPMPGIDPDQYRRTHGREVTLAEIGCYLSHLRAIRTFLEAEFDYGMILEDDTAITSEAVRLAQVVTAPGAPDDWDLIKFEAHHATRGLPVRPLFGPYRLCALPTRPTGAAAYLLNRRAAATLLEHLLPIRVPYDHAFDRSWTMRLRGRAILPLPIQTNGSQSTIVASGQAFRKVKLWQKGPTLLWRTGTEALRFVSALHAWVAPTRPLPWPQSRRSPSATLQEVEREIINRAGGSS